MTRFARAKGSKSCNKRTYEEATPWEEMKKDIKKSAQTKRLKKDEPKSDNTLNATTKGEVKKKIKSDNTLNATTKGEVKKKIKSKKKFDEKEKNEGRNEKIKKKKKSKNKKSGNQTNEPSREYRGKDPYCIVENGIKYRVFNGTKKPWFDLPFEENDRMTLYKKLFVKREDVQKLDDFKKSLEDQNLDESTILKKLFNLERKTHNKLRVELLREQIAESKGNGKKKKRKEEKVLDKKEKFENNDLATKFEGYWILKSNVKKLEEISEKIKERIIQARTNSNTDETLTAQEELEYRRAMKKEKRRETKLLINHVYNNEENKMPRKGTVGSKKPGKYLGVEFQGDRIEKFDGYFVSKEGAERLMKLHDNLASRGCSEEEIHKVIISERRKEERELKRKNQVFCFRCRKVGHTISTCPENEAEGLGGVDLCFKCGSSEHMARNCPANKKGFAHATCFICKETGHIAKECPDNPKGLYPNGGCCNACGSVEHLKRDCPEHQKLNEKGVMKVSSFKRGQTVDALDEENNIVSQSKTPKKGKRIVFDD